MVTRFRRLGRLAAAVALGPEALTQAHWRLCCSTCARTELTLYLWAGLCWCRHCLPTDVRTER